MVRIRFTNLEEPGITRRRSGRSWAFFDAGGARITDADERQRLLSIALPPAYVDAWYNPDPSGHILAHGTDARGRRQYRYHPDWRAGREADKFGNLAAFGKALPRIRRKVARDLRARRLTRDHVVAAIVRLLDCGAIRIGNEQYARANRSFGATTLRRRHARLEGRKLRLRFRAKGGVDRDLILADRCLSTTVRRCQELPGQHLFCWLDEGGEVHPVRSDDVNRFLRDAAGDGEVTAKQFRTWWASVLALDHLRRAPGAGLKPMVAEVAERLGNTPAVARASYIHPAVIALARGEGQMPARPRGPQALSPPERWLMALIG